MVCDGWFRIGTCLGCGGLKCEDGQRDQCGKSCTWKYLLPKYFLVLSGPSASQATSTLLHEYNEPTNLKPENNSSYTDGTSRYCVQRNDLYPTPLSTFLIPAKQDSKCI